MREIESSRKISGFSGFRGGKLKEDKVLDIRLIAYANAPRLMDMSRDKWQEG
jgi:hypothetical protein